MRAIKFRVWDGKEMNQVDCLDINGNRAGYLINWWDHSGDYFVNLDGLYKNPKAVLMQYTGLKDKNGKDIWEGDLIEVRAEGSAWTMIVEIPEIYTMNYEGDLTTEVIGNFYENEDLLKK